MKITNDKFDKILDDLDSKKKHEREIKKKVFNQNIKDHLVVMDEFGNIKKVDHSKEKRLDFLIFILVFSVLLLALLIYFDPVSYYWFISVFNI